jgi:RNA polymerase sigma-70 factor (ECF subfamily)
MSTLHGTPRRLARGWDNDHTRIALAAARHHARRRARRSRLQAADEEDLRQDALLALLSRAAGFDGEQGAFATFADLVVRHALFDRSVAERTAASHIAVGLELEDLPASLGEDPSVSIVARLDLARLWPALPEPLQGVLLLVAEEGSIADACRASAMPTSAFYRVVADLRVWLEAAGLGPREKKCGVDR